MARDQGTRFEVVLTERAFFCFLTGRDFAEKLYTERTFRTYPPSYTQFSDYLFVNYLPQELHAFLRKLIVTEDVGLRARSPARPRRSNAPSCASSCCFARRCIRSTSAVSSTP